MAHFNLRNHRNRPPVMLATIAIAACANASMNKLVGKWQMTNNPAAAAIYYIFKTNGTFVNRVSARDPKTGHTVLIESTGVYTYHGNITTQKITNIHASSDDPAENGSLKSMNDTMAKLLKDPKVMSGTVVWKDKDDAVLHILQPAMFGKPAKRMEVDLKRQSS